MAKDNIYDLHLTEVLLRLCTDCTGGGTSSNVPSLTLSSAVGDTLPENSNENVIFTSTVNNIPSGYSIQASSHVMSYPNGDPDTVSSSSPMAGPSTNVILGVVGSTFVVTSTVTLEHATDPDIVLSDTFTITSVLPIYYGVKTAEAIPTTTGLDQISSANNQFSLTSTVVGRMYIVLPSTLSALLSVSGPNGLTYTVANDFTLIMQGSLNYYILNYDTQLTGTNVKLFTLNFS